MEKIKVIIKRPGEDVGHVTWISNTLENLQKNVDGNIEVIPIANNILMICNEDGKNLGLEKNFIMGMMLKDTVVGTVIICGQDGEEFGDVPITRRQWQSLLEMWGN